MRRAAPPGAAASRASFESDGTALRSDRHPRRRHSMDFAYTPKVEELRGRVRAFLDDHIVPRIRQWRDEVHAGQYPVSFMEDLKALAKSEGLWNLFLPALAEDEPGTRLSNLEYAPLAEIMGRVHWASEA